MPIPLPLTVAPAPAGPPPRATALLAGILALAWAAGAVLGTGIAGEGLQRRIAGVEAAARLYADPGLWAPWQPWTSALLPDGGGGLTLAVWCLLVPGRALERRHGGTAAMLLAALLAAVGGTVHLLLGRLPVAEPGCVPLAAGLAVAASGALPGSRLGWGIPWYAVVLAGWRPIGSTSLATGAALAVGIGAALAAAGEDPPAALAALAATAGTGFLAGHLLARRG